MAKIVIYTSGTLGDHLPFIALGQALTQRGHQPLMVINQAMHKYAQQVGLDAVALTDVDRGPEYARENAWAWNHWDNLDEVANPKARPFDMAQHITQSKELIEFCQDADLLISISIRPLGYIAHAALNIPWLTVSMNPYSFWQSVNSRERLLVRESMLTEYDSLGEIITDTFAELGVTKTIPPWHKGWQWAKNVLLASSRHFSRPNLDQLQPHNSVDMTGFWEYQHPDWATWQPDETLREFCERRPIALAFSSQPLENPRQILAVHAQAAAQLDMPLLVVRGWAGFSEADLPPNVNPDNVMFTDFISYDWLFAQSACTIQHGGIGSIATALRQGCPLLVEPFGNDQLYNASRVANLGVGVAMHPHQLTADSVANALQNQVLTDKCRAQAEAVGAKLNAENGVENACTLIETYLERQANPASTVFAVAKTPSLIDRPGGKIIHQTWKDTFPRPNVIGFKESWQVYHPDWQYYFWTDEDLRAFIETHYAWFLPVYDNYPEPIMRVDAARYFILYHYGGIYADLDFECLRPLDPLLGGKQVVLGLEPEAHETFHFPAVKPFEHIVCNAFMASVPHHPFWEHVFVQLMTYHRAPDPLNATGPFMLTRAFESFTRRETISIVPSDLLYPISNVQSQQRLLDDPVERKLVAKKAFAVHHWHTTWWESSNSVRAGKVPVSILQNGQLLENTSLLPLEDFRGKMSENVDLPLVSCLLFVQHSDTSAQQAVHCFLQQTYPNAELIIADEDDSLARWIEQLNHSRITVVDTRDNGASVDELWQIALDRAAGDYIARWNEDDLSEPRRLEVQMAAILVFGVDACLLEREQLWQPNEQRLFFSERRVWGNSLVCKKEMVSPELLASQQTDAFVAQSRTALIDFPQLYTQLFNADNPAKAGSWKAYQSSATEAFEAEIYQIMAQQIQNGLRLRLSPQNELVPVADGQPAGQQQVSVIPKIIHQTWKNGSIPPDLAAFQRTWLQHNPDWVYHLWTDTANREFLKKHYPWFLPIYDNYPENIMRVDAVRTFILFHYGGLYVDLDFECLRPIEPLLNGKQLVFGLEPPPHLDLHFPKERDLQQIVCNAFMASVPGHPFWEHVFKQLIAWHRAPGPLDATGPFLITRSVESFEQPQQISIEPYDLLYPVSSDTPWANLPAEEQARITKTAYGIHHWRGSWWRNNVDRQAQQAKVSLLVRGQQVSAAAIQLNEARLLLNQMPNPPFVSCLMVTQNRPLMAQQAVRCFRQQTYANKELIIVDDGQDNTLVRWLDELADSRIVYLCLPAEDKTLGELRNIAVEQSSGDYVAQWDDDDLSDPQRLEVQLAVIQALQTDACFLERQQIWWPQQKRLALSTRRIWEGSFMCAKAVLPPYPTQRQGEDSPVVEQLVAGKRAAVLDLPQLYTYIFHGNNTFDNKHWEAHWLSATESFEGEMYSVRLEEFRQNVGVDLLPWTDVITADAETIEPLDISALPKAVPQTEGLERKNKQEITLERYPEILVLVPVKDAASHLPHFWNNLQKLTYPHYKISLAFLESDSADNTYALIEENLPVLQAEFAGAKLFKRDYAYRSTLPRWEPGEQYRRRSIMAKSRNYLLAQALADEEWVLWIDVDVARWPNNVVEQLLAAEKEIIVPNCISLTTGETFDYNTFKLKPNADALDWSPYILDGILQPPKGFGRFYLSDLREYEYVEIDAVGGTMLLIKADVHREGLVFPTFSYKHHIETEGLATMAKDMGYTCWGLPNLEIFHP